MHWDQPETGRSARTSFPENKSQRGDLFSGRPIQKRVALPPPFNPTGAAPDTASDMQAPCSLEGPLDA